VQTVRKIYESLPKVISVPDALKNRRVEVILLPLDDVSATSPGPTRAKTRLKTLWEHGKGSRWSGQTRANMNRGAFTVIIVPDTKSV